jgi:acetyl esterase/lipase
MNQDLPEDHISKRRVVLALPGADDVNVERNVAVRGADGQPLAMDLYRRSNADPRQLSPVVLIVSGYPDDGFERMLGCRFKETGSTQSWGRLIAAIGASVIAATNRAPVTDLHALVEHLRAYGSELGLDASRMGILASSGHVPTALSLLMRDSPHDIACAALLYGYMLDLDGATIVHDASATFRFANPCRGRTVADLRGDVPMFVARAGRDEQPGLNASIDAFLNGALARNLPITAVNHPGGPHAFDILDGSEASRRVIRQVLRFLSGHLS